MFILYGATGDLAKKKIIPALEKVKMESLFIGRKCRTKEEFIEHSKIQMDKSSFSYIQHSVGDVTVSQIAKAIKRSKSSPLSVYVALNNANEDLMLLLAKELKFLAEVENIQFDAVYLEKTVGNTSDEQDRIINDFREALSGEAYIGLIDHYNHKYDYKALKRHLKGKSLSTVDIKISVPDAYEARRDVLVSSGGVMGDMVQSHIFITVNNICRAFEYPDIDSESVEVSMKINSVDYCKEANVINKIEAEILVEYIDLETVFTVHVSNCASESPYNSININGYYSLSQLEESPYVTILKAIKRNSIQKKGVIRKAWGVIKDALDCYNSASNDTLKDTVS